MPGKWLILGGCIAITVREVLEHYDRKKDKRIKCSHRHYKVVTYNNYKTNVCKECGFQWWE